MLTARQDGPGRAAAVRRWLAGYIFFRCRGTLHCVSKQASTTPSPAERLDARELAAWRGFLRVHAALVRELDAELQAEHGVSLTAYEVLIMLEGAPEGRLRMFELSDAVLLSLSGVTRLVDRMVRDGLVTRQRCPSDRRGAFTVLSDAGRAKLAEARPTHLAGVRRRFLDPLTPEALDELATVWERLLPGSAS